MKDYILDDKELLQQIQKEENSPKQQMILGHEQKTEGIRNETISDSIVDFYLPCPWSRRILGQEYIRQTRARDPLCGG